MMRPEKYLLCLFKDGDARVYYADSPPFATRVAEDNVHGMVYGDDKSVLIGMAKLYRIEKWEETDIDTTYEREN